MKRITKLELPSNENEYGMFQLNDLNKVYFRFDMKKNKPKLMPDMFIDGEGFKDNLEGTKLYVDVQKLLEEHVREVA
ncbi:hypothetical protein [Vagococcus fluvialis]|uniref:hypothetical protein n=1 Tax=Vagococcus fluvialis TaxID=2738 RepID=UPI003D09FB3B